MEGVAEIPRRWRYQAWVLGAFASACTVAATRLNDIIFHSPPASSQPPSGVQPAPAGERRWLSTGGARRNIGPAEAELMTPACLGTFRSTSTSLAKRYV